MPAFAMLEQAIADKFKRFHAFAQFIEPRFEVGSRNHCAGVQSLRAQL